jgi:hypothetical protein
LIFYDFWHSTRKYENDKNKIETALAFPTGRKESLNGKQNTEYKLDTNVVFTHEF